MKTKINVGSLLSLTATKIFQKQKQKREQKVLGLTTTREVWSAV
jgi:hypothetical protein